MVNRLKLIMPSLIDLAQLAIFHKRAISDINFMSHDLTRGFHLNKNPLRMSLNVDLYKSFDTLNLDFSEVALLVSLNFPSHRIQL